MNKAELVDAVANNTGVAKGDVDSAISGMFDVLENALKTGEVVNIPGYLKVERSLAAARKGRNPQTGESIDIAASYRAKIAAGKKLKDAAKSNKP